MAKLKRGNVEFLFQLSVYSVLPSGLFNTDLFFSTIVSNNNYQSKVFFFSWMWKVMYQELSSRNCLFGEVRFCHDAFKLTYKSVRKPVRKTTIKADTANNINKVVQAQYVCYTGGDAKAMAKFYHSAHNLRAGTKT